MKKSFKLHADSLNYRHLEEGYLYPGTVIGTEWLGVDDGLFPGNEELKLKILVNYNEKIYPVALNLECDGKMYGRFIKVLQQFEGVVVIEGSDCDVNPDVLVNQPVDVEIAFGKKSDWCYAKNIQPYEEEASV